MIIHASPHERTDLAPMPAKAPTIRLQSHGIKLGPIPKSDLILDCRAIRNPYRILAGADLEHLIDWCRSHNAGIVDAYMTITLTALETLHDRRRDHTDPLATPFVVTTVCAYGQHRSVAVKHLLAERLEKLGYDVRIED